MKSISIKMKNYQNLGEVFLNDFSLLGFKLSIDRKCLDFYFILRNKQEDEKYLIKTSFLLDKENLGLEMSYINNPIHSSIFIDNFPENHKNIIHHMIDDIDATNSYYCDFKPIDIFGNNYKFTMIQSNISNQQKVKKLIIPFDIYIRIEAIRNKMVFKLPLNPKIDQDPIFNNIEVKYVNMDLLGYDIVSNNHIMFFTKLYDNNKSIGVFIPVENIPNGSLNESYKFDSKKFGLYFPNNFMVNIDRYYTIFIKEGNEVKVRLGILRKDMSNKVTIYVIINQDISSCILLNLYQYIYK